MSSMQPVPNSMVNDLKIFDFFFKFSYNRDTTKKHYFACLEAAGVMKQPRAGDETRYDKKRIATEETRYDARRRRVGGPDLCKICDKYIDKKFANKDNNHLQTHHMNDKKLLQLNKNFFKILDQNLKKSGK